MCHPNKPWHWLGIYYNPNIIWEIISANQDKPWNWSEISYNPNITWEIISANQINLGVVRGYRRIPILPGKLYAPI
jgi:hypothetical protein